VCSSDLVRAGVDGDARARQALRRHVDYALGREAGPGDTNPPALRVGMGANSVRVPRGCREYLFDQRGSGRNARDELRGERRVRVFDTPPSAVDDRLRAVPGAWNELDRIETDADQ